MPPLPGSRVVLRYRRPAGSVPSQSDALGVLESLTPLVSVRGADGELTAVDPADVVVLKAVPPRPVRTSAVRELERAAAFADPTLEIEWVRGWAARAGGDSVASSAVPLADPSMPEGDFFHDLLDEVTLRALADWYAARGLPLRLRLPDRLIRPPAGWLAFEDRLMLTTDLSPAGDNWAGLVLDDADADAENAAARIASLLAEAARLGAGRAYLEVPAGGAAEAAARAAGFGDHHRLRHVRLELDAP